NRQYEPLGAPASLPAGLNADDLAGKDAGAPRRPTGGRFSLLALPKEGYLFGTILSAALALTSVHAESGSVAAWGDNSLDQTNLPARLTNIVAIAAGANHTLALRSDGKVLAWGDDSSHQITLPANLTNGNVMAIG